MCREGQRSRMARMGAPRLCGVERPRDGVWLQ